MNNPAPRQPLTEDDWNFSAARVPDNELIPCLLWEFLRESATARLLANDWLEKHDERLLQKRSEAIKPAINYPFLFDDFIFKLIFVWRNLKMANVPWQKLPPNAQRRLAWPVTQVNKPVFIGDRNHAFCLNYHVNDPFEEKVDEDELGRRAADGDSAARDQLNKELDKAVLPARALLRSFTKPWQSLHNSTEKQEALCVVVDWGRYDNNAIRASFAELAEKVIQSRPEAIKPQVLKKSGLGRSTGDKSEWRGKLRDLGRTRLYCYYNGVEHLKKESPGAYKWIADNLGKDKGPRAVTKSLSDAKTRFVKAFQRILPFEKARLPLCVAAVKPNRKISN